MSHTNSRAVSASASALPGARRGSRRESFDRTVTIGMTNFGRLASFRRNCDFCCSSDASQLDCGLEKRAKEAPRDKGENDERHSCAVVGCLRPDAATVPADEFKCARHPAKYSQKRTADS